MSNFLVENGDRSVSAWSDHLPAQPLLVNPSTAKCIAQCHAHMAHPAKDCSHLRLQEHRPVALACLKPAELAKTMLETPYHQHMHLPFIRKPRPCSSPT